MLTQATLHELLSYNPRTGVFVWRVNRMGSARAGDVAGSVKGRDGNFYLHIGIAPRTYQAHRLAFLYMTGAWPSGSVDHKDGNGLNNRWSNIRVASVSLNAANAKMPSTNTSGFKGVTFHKQVGRWQAQIKKNGQSIYLGLFDRPEDAHAAYVDKAKEIFGEFARIK